MTDPAMRERADLSDHWREVIETAGQTCAVFSHHEGQSLALVREAWINAFDKASAELEQRA